MIRNGALHWEERRDPEPRDGELLIAVRAAGVNGADLSQLRGRYPAPPGVADDIPGLELAGEVVAIGRSVTRYIHGDRVMALVGGGAQATLAAADEAHAMPLPPELPWDQAGGFPEAFATAFDALFWQAGLRAGERVLVSGAAGGVGTAAVQLAAVSGAHVVAAVRDLGHKEALEDLGAVAVIEHGSVLDHGLYDVVLELVGAPALSGALPALAIAGRAVVIGVGAGAALDLDLRGLMGKRARISASTLRARPAAEKSTLIAAIERQLLPLLAAGRLRVPVQETFSLSEAPAAYGRFAAGAKLGKIVLVA